MITVRAYLLRVAEVCIGNARVYGSRMRPEQLADRQSYGSLSEEALFLCPLLPRHRICLLAVLLVALLPRPVLCDPVTARPRNNKTIERIIWSLARIFFTRSH